MNANTSAEQPKGKPDTTVVITKYMLQAGLFTLVQVTSLFIASGRLDWVMAWVYIGVYLAGMGINALVLIPTNPELVVERAQFRGKRDLDRALAGVMALYGPAGICIVAGLDERFGWSPGIPPALLIAALAIAVLGSLLTTWAMASNRFFYGVSCVSQRTGAMLSPPAGLIRPCAIRATLGSSRSISQCRLYSARCGPSSRRRLRCAFS